MYKRALVSVSDKTGLVNFLQPLVEKGLEIVSTGGTSKFLQENGFKVIDVSDVTHFPEVMDGRVKTLHPHIHMGLLARAGNVNDQKILEQFQVSMFDLVVVNLYPFEESLKNDLPFEQMIEKIDIGGPSMLRSAAKSFSRITVVCDPYDYTRVLETSEQDLVLKKELAAKVFYHTSLYDSLIAGYLNPENKNEFVLAGRLEKKLRYGENPLQNAYWYRDIKSKNGFHNFKIIQGKELSYNNLLDLDSALKLCLEIGELNAVAVKHNNPCGVAYGESSDDIVFNLLKTDPVSIFGGILACNFEITQRHAEQLNEIFLECIVAPSYSMDALKIFEKKKNLRLLKIDNLDILKSSIQVKTILGGFLIQTDDDFTATVSEWKVFGKQPSPKLIKEILFGEKVCGYLKSNSIALVDNGKTIGLGMGQVNRVDAVEQAIGRALKFHKITESTILISDAFFPFKDSIEMIAKHNIKWVFQPGGSIKDPEVVEAAKNLDVQLIFSGKRHFRH
ncbi:MAG: bifunctional phosphoribosylaminoimidazolecarboxamide formyltransferase/IMP cyclohydrolase [Bdellovibrionaceae bacterium]|nr:bifunctional phosphoribosylaminoimidazolecarboxamide formyltransferase/IMP cyclohydrolase [Pseudobdellovibrionaceae bacterium]NUM57448.1 bifunctional phosphoribosylaminoimidazolecarboxamide formyltransferase/IMP cyclohydrolase [Pseudobdellovibrionaceae bacterium]